MNNKHEWRVDSDTFRVCINCGLVAWTEYSATFGYVTSFYLKDDAKHSMWNEGFFSCNGLQIKNFLE
jgi:hypothetical protein